MIAQAKAPYTVENYTSHRKWLEARMDSIGGSEAAAVVGHSRFCGPLGLVIRKRERRVEEDSDNTAPMMEWGHLLEQPIADKFSAETGKVLHDPGEHCVYRSTERSHVTFTPDRMILDGPSEASFLEIKSAWYDAFKDWKERVPLGYQIQCQHSMYVTGFSEAYVAVLGNGYQFKWFMVERNQRFIDRLMDRIDRFWFDYVQKGIDPPADFSKSAHKALLSQYPEGNGQAVDLPEELAEVAAEYDRAKQEKADSTKRYDEASNRIKQAIGEATLGVLSDGTGFSWSNSGKTRRLTRKLKIGERV